MAMLYISHADPTERMARIEQSSFFIFHLTRITKELDKGKGHALSYTEMLYISHADPTERMARIERVKQGIEENLASSSVHLTRITKELDKGKGHALSYTELLEAHHCNKTLQIAAPATYIGDTNEEVSESSGSMLSAYSSPINPSGFQLGPSTEGSVTGNVGVTMSQRRRPHSWKQRAAGKPLKLTAPQVSPDEPELIGGLALLWKNCYEVEILSSSSRIIDARVKVGSLSFYVSCVYGDPIREKRKLRMIGKEGFEEAVIRGWNMANLTGETHIMDRIASCRRELARWKRGPNTNARSNVEIAKRFPDHLTMKNLKDELAEAHRQKELRELWLKEGGKNTTFFHNSVKVRRIHNKVLMLQDDDGTTFFSEGSKGHLAAEYFTELFMSSNPHDLESLFDGFEGRVSTEMNEMLTKEVTEEEIRVDAFNVRGSSALGEDGLTGTFYKIFWH
ncbi:hypothetical protein HID58_046944, partial [Brassica napus]